MDSSSMAPDLLFSKDMPVMGDGSAAGVGETPPDAAGVGTTDCGISDCGAAVCDPGACDSGICVSDACMVASAEDPAELSTMVLGARPQADMDAMERNAERMSVMIFTEPYAGLRREV